jgi:holo-[acyl-carrier protein] synthase
MSGGDSILPAPRTNARATGFSLVVGVDLVRVGDVVSSIARFGDRYTQRLFTDGEIGYCNQQPHLAGERFAARFAAKEATLKVLRLRRTDTVSWRSIEVRREPEGWCGIVLHDAARVVAEREGISGLSLSMSHEHEYATATVVACRAADERGSPGGSI